MVLCGTEWYKKPIKKAPIKGLRVYLALLGAFVWCGQRDSKSSLKAFIINESSCLDFSMVQTMVQIIRR